MVPKVLPNDRVRAKGPNEKASAGARMKRAEILVFLYNIPDSQTIHNSRIFSVVEQETFPWIMLKSLTRHSGTVLPIDNGAKTSTMGLCLN